MPDADTTDEPAAERREVTITSRTQLAPPRPRMRKRVVSEVLTTVDGAAAVFWATQVTQREWGKFVHGIQVLDEATGYWIKDQEKEIPHWLAYTMRDANGNRIWKDVKEAEDQLGQYGHDDLADLMAAANDVNNRQRAEGNSGAPSETTPSEPEESTGPSTSDTPTSTNSGTPFSLASGTS